MDPATIALLIKLAPYLLQGAVHIQQDIHSDIQGYQQVKIAEFQMWTAYYNAYARSQGGRIRYVRSRRR